MNIPYPHEVFWWPYLETIILPLFAWFLTLVMFGFLCLILFLFLLTISVSLRFRVRSFLQKKKKVADETGRLARGNENTDVF